MYSMVEHRIYNFVGYRHCLIYIVTLYQISGPRHEKCSMRTGADQSMHADQTVYLQ